jgi:hypothetical protein
MGYREQKTRFPVKGSGFCVPRLAIQAHRVFHVLRACRLCHSPPLLSSGYCPQDPGRDGAESEKDRRGRVCNW